MRAARRRETRLAGRPLLGLAAACLAAWLAGCGGDKGSSPADPQGSQKIPGVNTNGIIAYTHPPTGVRVKVPETFSLLLGTDTTFYLSLEADSTLLLMNFTLQTPAESLDDLEAQYRQFASVYTVSRASRGGVDGLDLRSRQQLPAGARYVYLHFLDQGGARLKIGYSIDEARVDAWEPLAKAIVESATLE